MTFTYTFLGDISPGTCFSSIVGGYCNCVFPGGNCTFIGGGENNCVTAPYSAVLGGSGNSDGGLTYAGVFGCNITAVSACTFHANNFAANNIPFGAGGATGTFYYINALGGRVVMIN